MRYEILRAHDACKHHKQLSKGAETQGDPSTWCMYLGKNRLIWWGSVETVSPDSLVPRHQDEQSNSAHRIVLQLLY